LGDVAMLLLPLRRRLPIHLPGWTAWSKNLEGWHTFHKICRTSGKVWVSTQMSRRVLSERVDWSIKYGSNGK
jgi:hypothetical protein